MIFIVFLFLAVTPTTYALVEEGWPAGKSNIPRNPTDGFIGFEEGTDMEEIFTGISGVRFTTTHGINWRYADIRTGNYNVYPYGTGAYELNGNFGAWLGVDGSAVDIGPP